MRRREEAGARCPLGDQASSRHERSNPAFTSYPEIIIPNQPGSRAAEAPSDGARVEADGEGESPDGPRPMNEVTRILSAVEQGDSGTTDQLLPLVYDELRRL